MITDIICIDDQFPAADEAYFKKHGIVKPVKDKVYTIRKVIAYVVGEKGLLLNEIVNPPTPKESPSTGITGAAEQSWRASRFTDLQGRVITGELQASLTTSNHLIK